MIRYEWGEHTATSLLLKDRDVQFKNYPGVDHEIAVEEVEGEGEYYISVFCLHFQENQCENNSKTH